MFRWYRDAEVCYAFLSDVDADENPHAEASSFRKARWFTRGWTLQELIAPGVAYFYGAGWKQIGSRETLLDLIVDITRIKASCFTTGDLAQFSAAQKMSWAAYRETTRVHLAGQKREVYIVRGYKERLIPGGKVANERRQLGELVLTEHISPEPCRVIRFHPSLTLSMRCLRWLVLYIQRISAGGTINGVISRMTLVSFLSSTF
jgi:hypothetical protein